MTVWYTMGAASCEPCGTCLSVGCRTLYSGARVLSLSRSDMEAAEVEEEPLADLIAQLIAHIFGAPSLLDRACEVFGLKAAYGEFCQRNRSYPYFQQIVQQLVIAAYMAVDTGMNSTDIVSVPIMPAIATGVVTEFLVRSSIHYAVTAFQTPSGAFPQILIFHLLTVFL